MVSCDTFIKPVYMGAEIRTLNDWALQLPETCAGLDGQSYFQALRLAASSVFGLPVGRVVPIESERTLQRMIKSAERNCRPFAVATRDMDLAEFVLLVDTKKNP